MLYSCGKDLKQLTGSGNTPVDKSDTFSLVSKLVNNCNSEFSNDTCFFQRIGDTIWMHGNIMIVCGFSTVIMAEKDDSILITWYPQKDHLCNSGVITCFDLKIPNATNYSVVKFLGKTYHCANYLNSDSTLLGKWNIVKDSMCAIIGPTLVKNPTIYTGVPSDYYNFQSNGSVIKKQGTVQDTFIYYFVTSNRIQIMNNESGIYNIKNLTEHTLVLTSTNGTNSYWATPAGPVYDSISLHR